MILVAGAPGSGKTTLAERLAAELRLPLLTKDSIKVTLAEVIGADGLEQSRRLGAASVAILYQAGQAILHGGSGVIIESAFWRGLEGQLAPLLAAGSPRLIRCSVPIEVALDRYRRRERHWVHFDRGRDGNLEHVLMAGQYDLELDVPTIDVETTDGYRPSLDAVVEFVRPDLVEESAPTKPATVHMIHGFLCVGKTWFAKALERETGAVRLSVDDWTIAASGDREHLDRVLYGLIRQVLEEQWIQLARRGIDVILDFGFWARAERDAARRVAAAIGADIRLYLVTCSERAARQRCERRNRLSDTDYIFGDGAFDALRERFEPLAPDEEHRVISTSDA